MTRWRDAARWIVLMLGLVAVRPVLAQEVPAEPDEAETLLALAFAEGVQAVENAAYEEAIPRLIRLYHVDSAYFHQDLGSLAYWLGRAYALTGQPEVAVRAWERGHANLGARDRIDLRLADAFVEQVFQQRDSARYAVAASAYLTLLAHLDGDLPPALEGLRHRHLAPLTVILPEDVRRRTGLTADPATPLAPGQGVALVTWWRSADALPATPENERLYEHLERLATAREQFAAEDPLGFDDRGRLYLRFGRPERQTQITFTEAQAGAADAFDAQDLAFPKNEFWIYPAVHRQAHYLFIQDSETGAFRLGLPGDLVPRPLRLHRRRTDETLRAYETIYRQLALWYPHGHYGQAYDRFAQYRLNREDGIGNLTPPWRFSQLEQNTLAGENQRAVVAREAVVPPSVTRSFEPAEALPVALRYARFLEEDGTTRTEIYWGLQARALHPSRGLRRDLRKAGHEPAQTFLLDLTLVQQDAAFRPRHRTAQRHLLEGISDDEAAVVPVQTVVARGDAGRYHLALQFDAYWPEPGTAAPPVPGPRLKVGTYRLDPLDALSAAPGRLEMSDLKPLRLRADGAPPEDAAPYPHATLAPDVPLALYFEVYHLTFGADDRTRYAVAYEIEQPDRRGFLGRRRPGLLQRAEARYTGPSRTAREYVQLDLGTRPEPGRLLIRVIVTDETTGQTADRTLAFEIAAPPTELEN